MRKQIFVDTVFVVALVNCRDQYHHQAADLAKQYEHHPLIVTDAVLIEIGNALSRQYRKESVRIIEHFFNSDEVEIVHLTPDLLNHAFCLYKFYEDKTWSLVDCISFVVMREAGITQAFTFDQHFVQAGFQALMRGIF